jgi:membrane protein DedA with SNARE-associated domain
VLEEFARDWGYLGVFVCLVLTGLGFPWPEELFVVLGGSLAGHPELGIYWWIMLPVCIVAVVISDGFLYAIGRLWGPRLVKYAWVKKHLLPPDRLERIERNFHEYGVKILLFARLTPGFRAPIFFTAGLTKLPLGLYILADGLYAIPGVSLLFFLGYYFTESLVNLIRENAGPVKWTVIVIVLGGVAAYLIYRHFRRPVVEGDPEEMPPIVEQVTTKIIFPKGHEGTHGHHPAGENHQPAAPPDAVEKPQADPEKSPS